MSNIITLKHRHCQQRNSQQQNERGIAAILQNAASRRLAAASRACAVVTRVTSRGKLSPTVTSARYAGLFAGAGRYVISYGLVESSVREQDTR